MHQVLRPPTELNAIILSSQSSHSLLPGAGIISMPFNSMPTSSLPEIQGMMNIFPPGNIFRLRIFSLHACQQNYPLETKISPTPDYRQIYCSCTVALLSSKVSAMSGLSDVCLLQASQTVLLTICSYSLAILSWSVKNKLWDLFHSQRRSVHISYLLSHLRLFKIAPFQYRDSSFLQDHFQISPSHYFAVASSDHNSLLPRNVLLNPLSVVSSQRKFPSETNVD